MKVRVTALVGHANSVLICIYGEPENSVAATPEWSWAANDDNGGMLKQLLKEAKLKCTPFQKRWLTEEVSDVTKSTTAETQAWELTNLLNMEIVFDKIRDHVDQMVTRHNARPRKKPGKHECTGGREWTVSRLRCIYRSYKLSAKLNSPSSLYDSSAKASTPTGSHR